MKIYRIRALRRIALPLLKIFSRDIKIRHPWVIGRKVFLNSFKHKGYWYHGKNREKNSMKLFGLLIDKGSTVVEIGGHIGFISMFFGHLVGTQGRVFVFEPGSNNLPYIRRNIESGISPGGNVIQLIEKAVGAENGVASIYEDSLTGQNNSLVRDFDGLRANVKFSYVKSNVQERLVPVITLDSFLDGKFVDFIKIDVEGFEWSVLRGAAKTIESLQPAVMVEVQANEKEIFYFFKEKGYVLFDQFCIELSSSEFLKNNVFCLHTLNHANFIEQFRTINSQKNIN